MLVVQQIKGNSQCLDGVLSSYRDKCFHVIKTLDEFHISHIPRERNMRANCLAQQASGYNVVDGIFIMEANPMVQNPQCGFDGSTETHQKADHDNQKDVSASRDVDWSRSVTGKSTKTVKDATDGNTTDQDR
jgi:hypothetical protein